MTFIKRPSEFLQTFLFASEMPLWKYCFLAFPVALVPSILLSASAYWVLGALGVQIDLLGPPDRKATAAEFFGGVVFAPVVETLLLAGALKVLSKFSVRTGFLASISGVLWGIGHGAFGLLWFFGPAWAFFVFSCAYLHWHKQSFGNAFLAAAAPHALINMTVMWVLFFFPDV